MWTVRDAASVEKQHKAVVAAVCDEFQAHGRNTARAMGHPDLKILVFPYPLESRDEADLLRIAEEFYPKFIELIGAVRP
jgi:hypothetical protein